MAIFQICSGISDLKKFVHFKLGTVASVRPQTARLHNRGAYNWHSPF